MCFSVVWLIQLIIWIVFIGLLFTIARIWLPDLLGFFGVVSGKVVQTIKLIIGFIIFCIVIWFLYDLLVCVGFGFPRMVR